MPVTPNGALLPTLQKKFAEDEPSEDPRTPEQMYSSDRMESLFSHTLFDFLQSIRDNSDTFDPVYMDPALGFGDTPAKIMPDELIRFFVFTYTNEFTDQSLGEFGVVAGVKPFEDDTPVH